MPIGTSDGEYFDNHFEAMVEGNATKGLKRVYISPSDDSTMPPGSSEKPAGEFKSGEATIPPGNSEKVEFTTASPLINITSGDIDTAINVGLSAGPGTMAGVRSATIGSKLSDLGHAQVLEAAGEHPDTIWSKTGFGRGADTRWRYEINDSAAKYDPQWPVPKEKPAWSKVAADESAEKKLSEVLDHPELYKAYPLLKDVKVLKDPGYPAEGAVYEAGSGPGKLQGAQIRMGVKAAENQGTLMHEVQHAIQGYEGFAKGGSPAKNVDYLKYAKDIKALAPEMEAIIAKSKDPKAIWTTKDIERRRYITQIANKYQEYTKAAYEQAREYYRRLAGEVESNNVDTRLLLTEAERRRMPPTWTEEYPRSKQIVRDEPTATTAYGIIDKGKFVKP